MSRSNFKRGGVQDGRGRGSGRFQRPAREENKISAKVASPGCFLLQYRTDGANDVTIWRKRLSVVANRECLTLVDA